MPNSPSPAVNDFAKVTRTAVQADATVTQVPSSETTKSSADTPNSNSMPFLSPPQASDEIGRLGEYRVLELLGAGGMGFVFRGEDTGLKRFVALKVMRPEVAANPMAAERFLREGRAAAGLKSDHIITIYQVGKENGVPFLAMEYLEGLPLDQWIKRQKKAISISAVIRVIRDVLRGLSTAHAKGLVHRDIKPANLWIEKGTLRIKLLDFGLTRSTEQEVQITKEGAVIGTPAYMAPEQARGLAVDPRSDLFSVGTVMYQLLTGKNPFIRDTMISTLGAVALDTQASAIDERPDIPREYSEYLDRLLAKDPSQRPLTAKEALAELQAIEKKLFSEAKTALATEVPGVTAQDVWSELNEANAVISAPKTIKPSNQIFGTKNGSNRKPPAWVWLVAGGFFASVLMLFGIIIIIKNKDGTETKIELPDGASVEVKKDGKTVAAVGPKTPATMAAAPAGKTNPSPDDANRVLAKKVLQHGGYLFLHERNINVTELSQLPDGPLGKMKIGDAPETKQQWTDADMDMFADADNVIELHTRGQISKKGIEKLLRSQSGKSIVNLHLASNLLTNDCFEVINQFPSLYAFSVTSNQLTDECFKFIASNPKITSISTSSPKITGSGLAQLKGNPIHLLDLQACANLNDQHLEYLKDMPKLHALSLIQTPISEVGFEHLEKCKQLEGPLQIQYMENVTDECFKQLEKLTNLKTIEFGTAPIQKITLKSIASLSKMKKLEHILISHIAVTDREVPHFLELPNLTHLVIGNAIEITESGLIQLAKIKSLKELRIKYSKITTEGFKKFLAIRPDVVLSTEKGVIEPEKPIDANRALAIKVIRHGGEVYLKSIDKTCKDVSQLPDGPIGEMAVFDAPMLSPQLTDDDLDMFLKADGVIKFTTRGNISDKGVSKILQSPSAKILHFLQIESNLLNHDSLKLLVQLPGLAHLVVKSDQLTDDCFQILASNPNIKNIGVLAANITGEGLASLKGKNIESINLSYCQFIKDDNLKFLKDLPNLSFLSIIGTPISEVGFQHISQCQLLNYLLQMTLMPNVTDQCFVNLEKMQNLKEIEYGWNINKNLTVASLASIGKMKGLQSVQLASLPISDQDLPHLIGLPQLSRLWIFEKCEMTDEGLMKLTQIKSLKDLRFPERKITAEGIKKFRAARPDVNLLVEK